MTPSHHRKRKAGFTLTEVMIASALMVLLSTGVMSFYIAMRKVWTRASVTMTSSLKSGKAMGRIVYGPNSSLCGLRSAVGSSVWSWSSGGDWMVSFNTNRWVYYSGSADSLYDDQNGLLCDKVTSATCIVSTVGADLQFTVIEGTGSYISTNSFRTFVEFRN